MLCERGQGVPDGFVATIREINRQEDFLQLKHEILLFGVGRSQIYTSKPYCIKKQWIPSILILAPKEYSFFQSSGQPNIMIYN
jgi:hypothetical protein